MTAVRWGAVLDQVRAEQQLRRHRASSDALVLQLTLQRVKQDEGSAALMQSKP